MTYVFVYIDDFIITINSNFEMNNLIQQLDKEFFIKDLGDLNYFLELEVGRISNSEIQLNQKKVSLKYLLEQRWTKQIVYLL